ncbi:MAG: hypothetical protein M3460_07640 [Actinomycetota bacterium]|nr:hypothetical protein [Actinomycetota bacterium]
MIEATSSPRWSARATPISRNLGFYLRRHGANRIIETDVDWALWWHYRAERGGTVVRHNGQLWALNGARDRRLTVPDASWLRRLDHCGHFIEEADPYSLATAQDCGVAYDPPASP